jgi:cytochrome c oxidase subunit 1
MPRHIYTYEADRGWGTWNLFISIGVIIQMVAIAIFVWNLIRSLMWGEVAGPDPWDAWTLEWATTSPPPVYNFAEEPLVHSRRPLWDLKHPEDPDTDYEM